MNLEQVAYFTEHPQELKFQDAAALKTLAGQYPYSSVYSLLYLTALSNGKSPELDQALKQQAYKLTDRTKLYHLLTGQAADNLTIEATVVETGHTELTSLQGLTIETPANEEVAPVKTIEPASLLEEGLREVASSQESPQEPASEAQPAEEIPTDLPLTFEQTEEAVIVFEAPAHEEPAIEPAWEKITEEASPTEGITTAVDFDELTEAFTREQHFDVAEPEAVSEPESTNSEQSEAVSEEIPVVEKAAEQPVQTPAVEGKKSFTSWLHSAQNAPVQPEPEPKKPVVNELIDKFIEREPSITRAKADFYSPSRKAKESLNEDAVPVSETLAKIYAAQGNYPKAIHVYHQLMLSFPEKKSLFAVQIEELKKKITP